MSKPITRSCTEVGPGDFVKVAGVWKMIEANTAFGLKRTPRSWTVTTSDGSSYDMFDIQRYAQRDDPR
jgi:hypothetical protein